MTFLPGKKSLGSFAFAFFLVLSFLVSHCLRLIAAAVVPVETWLLCVRERRKRLADSLYGSTLYGSGLPTAAAAERQS